MSWAMNLRTTGAHEAAGSLRRIGDRAKDPRRFFSRVRMILLEESRARWSRGGWVPDKATTLRRKAHAHHDPRTLRATGALERALTVFGAPGQLLEQRPTELRFGLKRTGVAHYGVFHQQGKGVPERRIVGLTTRTRRRVREALADDVLGR